MEKVRQSLGGKSVACQITIDSLEAERHVMTYAAEGLRVSAPTTPDRGSRHCSQHDNEV